MKLFKSQSTIALEERVQELETENADLRGQLEIAKQTAETDQAVALTDATEQINKLTEANAAIPELESKITVLEAKVTELEAAATITAEKIDIAAAQKLASMGHGEALNLGTEAPTETNAKELSLVAFNQLTPSQRMDFVKSGGKISN
jgi:chromosome segregation ATPase